MACDTRFSFHSIKHVSDLLGTIDYHAGEEVVLRIADEEKNRCVLQVESVQSETQVYGCFQGSNSPERLAIIAERMRSVVVERLHPSAGAFSQDVAAIDVNMGCRKSQ